jgi:hypothetical protein
MVAGMAKRTQPMTLDEARAILHRWRERNSGEHALVLAADKLLAEAWEQRREQQPKSPTTGLEEGTRLAPAHLRSGLLYRPNSSHHAECCALELKDGGGNVPPRFIADDFPAIRARMEELRRVEVDANSAASAPPAPADKVSRVLINPNAPTSVRRFMDGIGA